MDFSPMQLFLTMTKGLGLCLGVLFIGLHLLKRTRAILPSSSQAIMVVSRAPLTNKTSIALVECNGRQFLCGVGTEPVTIHELTSDNDRGNNNCGHALCRSEEQVPLQ